MLKLLMKTYLQLLVENSLDAPQIVCLVEAVVVADCALQVCILLDILVGPAPVIVKKSPLPMASSLSKRCGDPSRNHT